MFPDVATVFEVFEEVLEEFSSDVEGTPLSEIFEEVANIGFNGDG
jgi:hypothetical protein